MARRKLHNKLSRAVGGLSLANRADPWQPLKQALLLRSSLQEMLRCSLFLLLSFDSAFVEEGFQYPASARIAGPSSV